MTGRCARLIGIVAVSSAVMGTACSNDTPGAPSGTSASVAAPQPQLPVTIGQIAFANQPVTLTVQNAVVTKSGGTTYTFEVATDAGFAAKVLIKDGVAEGSNGQTSLKLDPLTGGKDYYWHARASGGGTTGPFGSTFKFTVGAAITIGVPVPIGPLAGAQSSPRPALRVTNAARQGAAGSITYRFEVARDSAFSSIVATGTAAEGTNETDFIPGSDLPTGATLFWRATAMDAANGITSAPSTAQSFTVIPFSQAERLASELGIVLWPGVQPPGSVGHATMGGSWEVQTMFHVPTRTTFQSPTPEMLRIFDLLDRGFEPDPAISWMNAKGYFTGAQWYPPPEKGVIGLAYNYIAARNKIVTNGIWDLVLKLE